MAGLISLLRAAPTVPSMTLAAAAARRAYATGTVKWFNTTKGFGFVADDEGGKDYFVHQTSIKMEGFRFLEEGERVQFDVATGEKGQQAINVTGINGAPLSAQVANQANQRRAQRARRPGQSRQSEDDGAE